MRRTESVYVAAASFPPTPQTYSQIEKKFRHDLEGVSANGAAGLVFFTNQRLSPSERQTLQGLAQEANAECTIYHLERIRALLDAPRGYGVRLEFLRIEMSKEEQLGYFGEWKNDFQAAFRDQREGLQRLAAEVDLLRTQTMSSPAIRLDSPNPPADPFAATSLVEGCVSEHLTVALILMLHRAACIDIGISGAVGSLRRNEVWIGNPGEGPERASFRPPPSDQVPSQLSDLLSDWNTLYSSVKHASDDSKVEALGRFHHRFVSLHPFVDGNGRVARILLSQQVLDLFGPRDSVTLDQGAAYYAALKNADDGNYSQLEGRFDAR